MPTLKAPKLPTPDWKRAMETGMQVTELRRSQAKAIANDLVAQGQIAREQVAAAVDDLLDMSPRRSDDLRKIVRDEVQRQLSGLGLATKKDLAALERRMQKATREAKKKTAPSTKKPASKKTTKSTNSSRKAG